MKHFYYADVRNKQGKIIGQVNGIARSRIWAKKEFILDALTSDLIDKIKDVYEEEHTIVIRNFSVI